jgi:hypothetical protein
VGTSFVLLSVFDDRQTHHEGTRDGVRWASACAELDGERRDNDLYWFSPPE